MNVVVAALALVAVGVIATSQIPSNSNYSNGRGQVAGVNNPVAKASIATGEGKTAFVQGRAGAVSNFPLTLDQKTGQLTVETPNGLRNIAVLPEDALNNLRASKLLTDVSSSVTTGPLASITEVVNLENYNGVLSYKVQGVKKMKIFGLIPVSLPVTAYVSSETGQVTDVSTSWLTKILNKVSF